MVGTLGNNHIRVNHIQTISQTVTWAVVFLFFVVVFFFFALFLYLRFKFGEFTVSSRLCRTAKYVTRGFIDNLAGPTRLWKTLCSDKTVRDAPVQVSVRLWQDGVHAVRSRVLSKRALLSEKLVFSLSVRREASVSVLAGGGRLGGVVVLFSRSLILASGNPTVKHRSTEAINSLFPSSLTAQKISETEEYCWRLESIPTHLPQQGKHQTP